MTKDGLGNKITGILSGVSGEYFVAAQLSRLGFIASITLKNTKGVDVLVTNEDASKIVSIQVKSNQGRKKAWLLDKKAETYVRPNHFYVFVNLRDKTSLPEFYIVRSKVVADHVQKNHDKWLYERGRKGQPHIDNPMRMFGPARSKDLGNWKILGL